MDVPWQTMTYFTVTTSLYVWLGINSYFCNDALETAKSSRTGSFPVARYRHHLWRSRRTWNGGQWSGYIDSITWFPVGSGNLYGQVNDDHYLKTGNCQNETICLETQGPATCAQIFPLFSPTVNQHFCEVGLGPWKRSRGVSMASEVIPRWRSPLGNYVSCPTGVRDGTRGVRITTCTVENLENDWKPGCHSKGGSRSGERSRRRVPKDEHREWSVHV